MIVRPSPHKRQAAENPPVQWPPRSPFHALVSSPSGQQRWQQMQDRLQERSPSPSSRHSRGTGLLRTTRPEKDLALEDSTEEDESSLKLKLEILETKQKLREFKKKQVKQGTVRVSGTDTTSAKADRAGRAQSPFKRQKLNDTRTHAVAPVEVAVSPVKVLADRPPVSPARARLGLHGITKAEDVSLKRKAGYPSRTATTNPGGPVPTPAVEPQQQSVSSFSRRLAELKQASSKKQAKSDRIDSLRHKTFASRADPQPRLPGPAAHEYHAEPPQPAIPPAALSPTRRRVVLESMTEYTAPEPKRINKNSKDPSNYDPFSELHLSSRKMPHSEVAKALAGTEIYTIPRLFKEVKAPEYDPPDCESDFVVFGILAEKSAPFRQRPTHHIHDQNDKEDAAVSLKAPKAKFMVLRLCDLKWELDCYLFGTGFDKFWKLTEGTLLAILNPDILPPKTNQHSGKFSLKLASSDDCVLEIGTARDIGHCTATKKDNMPCTSWLNKAKATLCDFHLNLHVGRARKGRMEVNDMWRGVTLPEKPQRTRNPNVRFNAEHGQIWGVGGGRSAATLLDDEETTAFNNLTSAETSRKRIAAAQRERDLASKLGATGGGVAGEYFRAAYGTADNTVGDSNADGRAQEVNFIKPTAAELGLLGKIAGSQRLSPAKDRKRHFGVGAISSSGIGAMGWGGSRKAGLLQPAHHRLGSPERGQSTLTVKSAMQGSSRERSLSPRKRARFNLAQGIRTPGRESGGPELLHGGDPKDDDHDDDLDII